MREYFQTDSMLFYCSPHSCNKTAANFLLRRFTFIFYSLLIFITSWAPSLQAFVLLTSKSQGLKRWVWSSLYQPCLGGLLSCRFHLLHYLSDLSFVCVPDILYLLMSKTEPHKTLSATVHYCSKPTCLMLISPHHTKFSKRDSLPTLLPLYSNDHHHLASCASRNLFVCPLPSSIYVPQKISQLQWD